MLSNWLKLRRHRHEVTTESSKWPRNYSCSSFKGIQNLIYDDSPYFSPSPSPEASPRRSILHQSRSLKIYGCNSTIPPTIFSVVDIPNGDHRGVVLYYTSLRIVRKTFEECRSVKSILHRLRIPIDERDLSMDSRFHDELEKIFGEKKVALPKVFIGGRYIGGMEEIKRLYENDELRKMIGESDENFGEVCGLCRGWRFVVCEKCNGSHKIFSEKSGFMSCSACSVQGLIRCKLCFPMHRRRSSGFSGGWKCKN